MKDFGVVVQKPNHFTAALTRAFVSRAVCSRTWTRKNSCCRYFLQTREVGVGIGANNNLEVAPDGAKGL